LSSVASAKEDCFSRTTFHIINSLGKNIIDKLQLQEKVGKKVKGSAYCDTRTDLGRAKVYNTKAFIDW
jgi:hypothetical protein